MECCHGRGSGHRLTLSAALRGAVQQQARWLPQPVPVAGGLFVDCSNYSGALTDQGCADLKAAGYVGVIVQSITGTNGISYTRQQLDAAVRNGLRVRGYCWSFPNTLSGSMQSRLQMFNGFQIEDLWLDVEQKGLVEADVDRDLVVCDSYLGQKVGIYTARGVYASLGFSAITKWSDRPLWDANWDGIADVDVGFMSYGGWDHCQVKQFGGENSIGSVTFIDLNISR